MKPDKIYVDEDLINFHVLGERIHENDVEYIRKDYLLELIEEEEKFWDDGEMFFRGLKNKLNEI